MDKMLKVEKKSFELSKNDLLSRVIAVLKPEGTDAEVSTKVADLELVYMLDLTDLDCGMAPVTEALVEMLFEQFDFTAKKSFTGYCLPEYEIQKF